VLLASARATIAATSPVNLIFLFAGGAAGAALIGLLGTWIRLGYERTERRRDLLVDAADRFATAAARLSEAVEELAVSSLEAETPSATVTQTYPSSGKLLWRFLFGLPVVKWKEVVESRRLIRLIDRITSVALALSDTLHDPDLSETPVEEVSPELQALTAELFQLPPSEDRQRAIQMARDIRKRHVAIRHVHRRRRAAYTAFHDLLGELSRITITFARTPTVVDAANAVRGAAHPGIRAASYPRPAGLSTDDVAAASREIRTALETFAEAAGSVVRKRRLYGLLGG
jgi:hypothetical protein